MTHAPVTIVILAWNAWEATRACLESLRPTLGTRDDVIVVDNGSTDGTGVRLTAYPWVRVLSNTENNGFAAGCNQGAASARHDILVFLNNDTVVPSRWLDPLLAPFDDPAIGAVGPCSNFVSGKQMLGPANYRNRAEMNRFARIHALEHRGEIEQVERLVGFCLAVRRRSFQDVGGFDEGYGLGGFEDDDLCQHLLHRGWRLCIAHASYVHHEGHKSFDENGLDWLAIQRDNQHRFTSKWGIENPVPSATSDKPLVSACLIVRDEEKTLATCLSSIAAVADECIVYDTGSTDRTIEVAEQHGAHVIEGYWDDDFARARNDALAHCQGRWILWVDADETLESDPHALRVKLGATAEEVHAYLVPIDNEVGFGLGAQFVHSAVRLFRREACQWQGRLHERVVDEQGMAPSGEKLAGARIHHRGYLDAVVGSRSKADRNLRIAEAAANALDMEQGLALINLGRAQRAAGQITQALANLRLGAASTQLPYARRLALRTEVDIAIEAGDYSMARERLDELSRSEAHPLFLAMIEGKLELALGNYDRAVSAFLRLNHQVVDDDGFSYGPQTVAAGLSEALVEVGRLDEGLGVLLTALAEHGVLDVPFDHVLMLAEMTGRSTIEVASSVPVNRLPHVLGQVIEKDAERADEILHGFWAAHPGELAVVAAASRAASNFPVNLALFWSVQLRDRGLSQACPLLAIARNWRKPLADRILAAALTDAGWADQDGRRLCDDLMARVGEEREPMLEVLRQVAPAVAARYESGPSMVSASMGGAS